MGLLNILGIGTGIAKAVDEYILTDEEEIKLAIEQRKLELGYQALLIEADKAQMAVNAEEAKNSNLFISGWRPAVGWVCVVALIYNAIIYPSLNKLLDIGQLDTGLLYPLLMGMLGMGGLRTYEKLKNVESNR